MRWRVPARLCFLSFLFHHAGLLCTAAWQQDVGECTACKESALCVHTSTSRDTTKFSSAAVHPYAMAIGLTLAISCCACIQALQDHSNCDALGRGMLQLHPSACPLPTVVECTRQLDGLLHYPESTRSHHAEGPWNGWCTSCGPWVHPCLRHETAPLQRCRRRSLRQNNAGCSATFWKSIRCTWVGRAPS